jgi:hypothetical protein
MRRRCGRVRLLHHLDFNGTRNGIKDTGKFREHAIACRIGDAASMLGNQMVDDRTTCRQGRHRRLLVALHEAAISFDIGGKDRSQPPFEFRCFHERPPQQLF